MVGMGILLVEPPQSSTAALAFWCRGLHKGTMMTTSMLSSKQLTSGVILFRQILPPPLILTRRITTQLFQSGTDKLHGRVNLHDLLDDRLELVL